MQLLQLLRGLCFILGPLMTHTCHVQPSQRTRQFIQHCFLYVLRETETEELQHNLALLSAHSDDIALDMYVCSSYFMNTIHPPFYWRHKRKDKRQESVHRLKYNGISVVMFFTPLNKVAFVTQSLLWSSVLK